MINRREVPELFEPDGAYRSVMVMNIDEYGGQTFLDLLQSGRFGPVIYAETDPDSETASFPSIRRTFREICQHVGEAHPWVEFQLEGLRLWTDFLTASQWLELDFDPQQMTEKRLAALIDFITTVGRALGRDCIVAQESAADHQILAYRVDSDRVVPITHRHRRRLGGR